MKIKIIVPLLLIILAASAFFFLSNQQKGEEIYKGGKEHDLIGLGGIIFQDFIHKEFHLLIERWRSEAWVNMQLTKATDKKRMYTAIAVQTEQMGKDIIELFTNMYHLKGVLSVLPKVNSLSVSPFMV